jgi:protein-S-isoprenylcysteine O-methyltransferase Ste14
MLGLPGLRAWASGDRNVPIEPEAQGPALDASANRMKVTGPFRVSRHPLNFAPIPLFWLNPRMTSNFAAFTAVATLYFAVGSLHEEHRLRRAYGRPYEDYQQSTVRFLVPGSKARALRRT